MIQPVLFEVSVLGHGSIRPDDEVHSQLSSLQYTDRACHREGDALVNDNLIDRLAFSTAACELGYIRVEVVSHLQVFRWQIQPAAGYDLVAVNQCGGSSLTSSRIRRRMAFISGVLVSLDRLKRVDTSMPIRPARRVRSRRCLVGSICTAE